MNHFFDTFSTPCGPFSIAVDEAGGVRATAFGTTQSLAKRLGPAHVKRDSAAVRHGRDQVLAYFAGERRAFELTLAECGTAFQQLVWKALQVIPWGETRTYADIAKLIGNPNAARAVGRANATNPICLIVPCHRVIGSDGSLTGFAFGEEIKRRLLAHETAVAGDVHAEPRAISA